MDRKSGSIRKERALALRRQGWSYSRISAELAIPKSTLSYYFRNNSDSQALARELATQSRKKQIGRLAEITKARWHRYRLMRQDRRAEASLEISPLSANERRILFLGLFWGEGHKRSLNRVEISNTDPLLLKACVDFLRLDCGLSEDSIKARLTIHDGYSSQAALMYWSKELGIPISNFRINRVKGRPSTPSKPRHTLLFGTCDIQVGNTVFRDQVHGWLDGLKYQVQQVPTTQVEKIS